MWLGVNWFVIPSLAGNILHRYTATYLFHEYTHNVKCGGWVDWLSILLYLLIREATCFAIAAL